jgi:acyl-homoserine-lactone acylase
MNADSTFPHLAPHLAPRTGLARTAAALLTALVLASCGRFAAPPPPIVEVAPEPMQEPAVDPRVEILWDEWGVPHIFADDDAALFYANGWAMMQNHGDLVLRLYGQARGRAAEYWGARYADSDIWVRTNDVPARAERWFDEQVPHARVYLESFAAGMNAWAMENPDAISAEMRQVLPVSATDVLAHQQRGLLFTFIANPAAVMGAARAWQNAPAPGAPGAPGSSGDATFSSAADFAAGLALPATAGSNAWAVAPSRSATGNALLLMNPHLPWGDIFTFWELHLSSPEVNAYGAGLVGVPLLAMGFNEHLGWAHTVNTINAYDVYELRLDGDGYVLDGVHQQFHVRMDTVRVLQPDGSITAQPLPVRRSVHGPVIAQRQGRALALRVAGVDGSNLVAQHWDMLRATNRASFEAALSRLQLPFFTVMYADRAGDIMHVFNGAVPARGRGDWAYWQGIVPGDSSATLWTRVHDYHELPRVVNPQSGWLQNANDPPWTTTIPFPLNPGFYPPYVAPQRPMAFRPIRSARMLAETPRMTLDRMVELKHSTRMQAADHLVSDVVAAARQLQIPAAAEAAEILQRWDRTTDAGSRGAVLFAHYYRAMSRQRWPTGSMFEVPWSAAAPLATPDGLADPRRAVEVLAQAAAQVRATYGALDIAWGDVYRLRRDGVDLPANGGPGELGIFRVTDFDPIPGDTTRFVATSGDTFVAAVEFGTPIRARVMTAYGNSSQRGSPHRTDQLALYARKEMRPVRFTREEVLPHVVRRDAF